MIQCIGPLDEALDETKHTKRLEPLNCKNIQGEGGEPIKYIFNVPHRTKNPFLLLPLY